MKILITGSSGFIGRNLVELFLGKKYSVLFPTHGQLDLTDDNAVGGYLKNNPVEVIIHCATTLRDGTGYPANTCQNNLRMFFNLQKHMASTTKLINLGSGSEYNRKHWHKKMPEDFFGTHTPEDDHSYAKYLISKYIRDTNHENLICLRPFGAFGKYEDYRYKFISNAIVKNLLKMPIVINQNVVYDYIYITDFFRVVEYFVNHKVKDKIFNVTPTESIDLVRISGLINQVSDYKSEIQVLHEGIGVEYSGDNHKLLSAIGDFSFMTYEAAITDLYQYYKKIRNSLDAAAVKKDVYLEYAKRLRTEYFNKQNEK